jgi:glycerol-1-phosphate dehydrogenase [NAD(P)+]
LLAPECFEAGHVHCRVKGDVEMKLPYDPARGQEFWEEIRKIRGYPRNEFMPIRQMLFESNAVYKISDVLRAVGADPARNLFVVADQTSMRRAADDLKKMIVEILKQAGWRPELVWMAPDDTGQVHTDMPHIQDVKSRLEPGCAVLSVGSGTVTDIAKHACYLHEKEHGQRLPFVVFQTANSVSAFTSNMAPTFVDGVKRTLASRYPDALICDLETLRDAPREMTVAGVGDMLAAFVSLPDWYLASTLGMDPGYSGLPGKLIGPLDQVFLSEADNIRIGSLDGMSVLAKVIALGGLAMSLSQATTPLSGFEHVMSHVLDLQAEVGMLAMPPHGTQVALTTLIGVEIYRHFLAEFDPQELDLDLCYPDAEEMQKIVELNYRTIDATGKAGAECWSDYRVKLAAWDTQRSAFREMLADWPRVRERLRDDGISFDTLVEILQKVDAPLTWAELIPPVEEARVKFAFLNAPLMRKRLTIGDLLIFTNWNREALWQKIWERLIILK